MAYLVDGKTFYEKRPLGVDSLGHTDDELEDCFPAYGIQTLDDLMALKEVGQDMPILISLLSLDVTNVITPRIMLFMVETERKFVIS